MKQRIEERGIAIVTAEKFITLLLKLSDFIKGDNVISNLHFYSEQPLSLFNIIDWNCNLPYQFHENKKSPKNNKITSYLSL